MRDSVAWVERSIEAVLPFAGSDSAVGPAWPSHANTVRPWGGAEREDDSAHEPTGRTGSSPNQAEGTARPAVRFATSHLLRRRAPPVDRAGTCRGEDLRPRESAPCRRLRTERAGPPSGSRTRGLPPRRPTRRRPVHAGGDVVGPQLRAKSREAGEQRRVQDALAAGICTRRPCTVWCRMGATTSASSR
jgi:hypothetical protein